MDFLLEIGVEEMPARFCAGMSEALLQGIVGLCRDERLFDTAAGVPGHGDSFVTPRRIAARVEFLRARQADRSEEVIGPPARAAFDPEGRPTKAGEGFARSRGARPEDLRRVTTPKGEYAGLTVHVPGRPTAEVLRDGVPLVVAAIPLPIAMKWGNREGPFLRPVRWVVALLDSEILPLEIFGAASDRMSRGHRVYSSGRIAIPGAGEYEAALRAAGVEPNAAHRRRRIETELSRAASIGEGRVVPSEALLDEVVHLTEHPVVIAGEIRREHLPLPEEVLITAMGHHQRFFAVRDGGGRIAPRFLAVLNASDDSEGTIRRGCEDVLRARLEDARFFFEEDGKTGLEGCVPRLSKVTFQEKLGSYADKAARMDAVAPVLGESAPRGEVLRAIRLLKADLTTRMVGEFPELQGIMGGIYARLAGDPEAVWTAIADQYRPIGVDDSLPRGAVGRAVGLLDRLDTIVGCLGAGIEVSGSKDLFGLRRAALAAGRLLVQRPASEPPLRVQELLRAAVESCSGIDGFDAERSLRESSVLFENRLRYLFESRGHAWDEINAVFASDPGWDDPRDAAARLVAVQGVRRSGRLEALSVPFKRMKNILADAAIGPGASRAAETDPCALALWDLQDRLRAEVGPRIAAADYASALEALTAVQGPLDEFFIKVLVMHPEAPLREARLLLLHDLRSLFLRIFDPSEIAAAGAEPSS